MVAQQDSYKVRVMRAELCGHPQRPSYVVRYFCFFKHFTAMQENRYGYQNATKDLFCKGTINTQDGGILPRSKLAP